LESTKNRRSVGRHGNKHVYVRYPQVSGSHTTRAFDCPENQSPPVHAGGPFVGGRTDDDPIAGYFAPPWLHAPKFQPRAISQCWRPRRVAYRRGRYGDPNACQNPASAARHLQKILHESRDFIVLGKAAAQFVSDIYCHLSRPALGGVEGDKSFGVGILLAPSARPSRPPKSSSTAYATPQGQAPAPGVEKTAQRAGAAMATTGRRHAIHTQLCLDRS
jgi:hypothetical protein